MISKLPFNCSLIGILAHFLVIRIDPHIGNLTWTIWADDDSELVLLLYDDTPKSWLSVYPHRHSLTCEQKVNNTVDGKTGKRKIKTGQFMREGFNDTFR